MTANKLATYASIGLAAVAVWYVTRERPANAQQRQQPAEQAKQAGLFEWLGLQSQQWEIFGGQAMNSSISTATQPFNRI